MQTQADMEMFRLRFRAGINERLILKLFFIIMNRQGISAQETSKGLEDLLDEYSALALRVYGAALADPGLTALFGDEAKDITDSMKKIVAETAAHATKAFGA